jgi:hypothetical protein
MRWLRGQIDHTPGDPIDCVGVAAGRRPARVAGRSASEGNIEIGWPERSQSAARTSWGSNGRRAAGSEIKRRFGERGLSRQGSGQVEFRPNAKDFASRVLSRVLSIWKRSIAAAANRYTSGYSTQVHTHIKKG